MKASDGTMVSTLSFSRPVPDWLDVGLDAAVGDRERLAVGEQDHLVRADAVGRELADALVAAGRVVDAEHAGARVVVVLGRIEQARVRREHAVAVEVPVRRRREQHRLARAVHVEGERERSRAPREHDRLAAPRRIGDVVAAPLQRHLAHDRAVEAQDHHGVAAVRALAGGDEIACRDRVALLVAGQLRHARERARRRRQHQRRPDQKLPPVNRHRAH